MRALESDRNLNPNLSAEEATDLLMCIVSVENWEYLVHRCGWTQARYIETIQRTAKSILTE